MNQGLRIAFISEHASPLAAVGGVDAGGQNIYVAHLARCLARAGHQVDVLTRRDAPDLLPVVDMCPGVRVLHIPAGPPEFVPKERLLGHMPAFTNACEKLLRSGLAYDLVHANFFMSGVVAQRLRKSYGLPFVMTFHALGLVRREHQGNHDGFPDTRVAIERMLMREADGVIAECPQDLNDMLRLYGAVPGKITVLPCGFDPDEFRPMDRGSARDRLGLSRNDFIVLQLGRMVPRKGIDNVVSAIALLPRSLPARLLVVGGETEQPDEIRTPEIGRLQQLALQLGVADRVHFVGHRQHAQLASYYAAADVFVTTPWYEPFGITPLEAMACGIPVIGSAVGGIQHTVVDGETGYLVPARDAQALARRLRQLHRDPALGRALGLAGLRRARQHYTWENVAGQLVPLYHSVLRSCANSRPAPGRAAAFSEPVAPV